MKRHCMNVACSSCCREIATYYSRKEVRTSRAGTQTSPQLMGPELAAVKTAGGICAILGAGSPGACGCHATLLIREGDREATAGQWRHSEHNLAKPKEGHHPEGHQAPTGLRQITACSTQRVTYSQWNSEPTHSLGEGHLLPHFSRSRKERESPP